MFDIVLEILISFVVLTISIVLLRSLKHPMVGKHPGLNLILIGFGLLMFSSTIDVTDNFPSLNSFVLIGDTNTQAFLEKVVGTFLGMIFLLRGFSIWLPNIQELEDTRHSLQQLTLELDNRVRERSFALQQSNDSLVEEISERRKIEKRLKYQALHDELTGLPNRSALIENLESEVVGGNEDTYYSAILFLDLNGFKQVNDLFGHGIGDAVLKIASDRLKQTIFQKDQFVGRLGGDEFVLFLRKVDGSLNVAKEIVSDFVERIMSGFSEPIFISGKKINISCSIGVKVFSSSEQLTVYSLLQQADIALYQAKSEPSNRKMYRFFESQMLDSVKFRAMLANEMRDAIEQGAFYLEYQPQVSNSGHVVGVEALIRWDHQEKDIGPSDFIPIAEEAGLVDRLGRFVLRRALQDVTKLLADKKREGIFKIAVNISPNHFFQADFVDQVRDIISCYELNNYFVVLEITESVLIKNVEDISIKMAELHKLGVGISLDDFGTGYSSLSYLKLLPFDTLKIDRSFIRDILVDPNDAAIVDAILSMARALNLDVIAEGVETKEQKEYLNQSGCTCYQGYYFSKPVVIDALDIGRISDR